MIIKIPTTTGITCKVPSLLMNQLIINADLVSRSKSMISPPFFQKTVGGGEPRGGAQSNRAVPHSCTPTSDGSRRNLSFSTER